MGFLSKKRKACQNAARKRWKPNEDADWQTTNLNLKFLLLSAIQNKTYSNKIDFVQIYFKPTSINYTVKILLILSAKFDGVDLSRS